MKDKFYINSLLDIYGSLLTKKQLKICNYYYKDDYSLAEIASNENVSRNAIHDIIKRSESIMLNYEEKLNIYESYLKRKKIYDKLENLNNDKVNELIKKLNDIEIGG